MSGSKRKLRSPIEFHQFLVDSSGNALGYPVQIPNSCIESAEFAIQSFHLDEYIQGWKPNEEREPHVWAKFGDGKEVNITTENLISYADTNGSSLKDYDFEGALPKCGEGIILLHTKNLTGEYYHMHLAAVLATFDDGIRITCMAERASGQVKLAALKTEDVDSISAFRTKWFEGQESEYVAGLLYVKGTVQKSAGIMPAAASRRSKRLKASSSSS